MLFSKFSEYLEQLDNTSKRLEITSILSSLISNLELDEIQEAIYMSLGLIDAPYKSPNFSIAEKMMVRSLSFAHGMEPKEVDLLYSKLGDLGIVGQQMGGNADKKLTILQVHELLVKIANIQGEGSQELKVSKVAELLSKLDSTSSKFAIKIILNTTRLGFTELTIIDALSQFIKGDKSAKEQIENKYNSHPDIGLLAKYIKKDGLDGLDKVQMEIGVPILPQRCQRLNTLEEIIEKMGLVWVEFKFDGTRVQLHLDRDQTFTPAESPQSELFALSTENMFIKTYTRNLEDSTHQYPDINQAADKQIKARSVILDGEAIGFDTETKEFVEFQKVMTRKRKHNVLELAKLVPLKYFVFDILYLNGQDLTLKPLKERHELLKGILQPGEIIEVAKHVQTEEVDELSDFFEESKEKSLEGIIIKKPTSPYQAGARSFNWVKFKKADEKIRQLQDTIDVVVLGYYHGRGVRTQFGIGGFLAGVIDTKTDTIKSVTKVGTGLKDDDFIKLKKLADAQAVSQKPQNYDVAKIYDADVWVKPKIIVELGADEVTQSKTHSAGYALRFPRLIKFRTDKNFVDTTNTEEIEQLYKNQKRGYY